MLLNVKIVFVSTNSKDWVPSQTVFMYLYHSFFTHMDSLVFKKLLKNQRRRKDNKRFASMSFQYHAINDSSRVSIQQRSQPDWLIAKGLLVMQNIKNISYHHGEITEFFISMGTLLFDVVYKSDVKTSGALSEFSNAKSKNVIHVLMLFGYLAVYLTKRTP